MYARSSGQAGNQRLRMDNMFKHCWAVETSDWRIIEVILLNFITESKIFTLSKLWGKYLAGCVYEQVTNYVCSPVGAGSFTTKSTPPWKYFTPFNVDGSTMESYSLETSVLSNLRPTFSVFFQMFSLQPWFTLTQPTALQTMHQPSCRHPPHPPPSNKILYIVSWEQ